jgi:hypothetical protein
MTDRVSHGQHGQPEGERNAEKADAEIGKPGSEHRRAAAAKHQPESAEKLGGDPPPDADVHRSSRGGVSQRLNWSRQSTRSDCGEVRFYADLLIWGCRPSLSAAGDAQ